MKMKKIFCLLVLAALPISFAACSDESDEERGLTISNLIGDWIVVESNDGVGRKNNNIGQIWSFKSDGTFYHSMWKDELYSTWEIKDGKVVFQRAQREWKETYSAEIKGDGMI